MPAKNVKKKTIEERKGVIKEIKENEKELENSALKEAPVQSSKSEIKSPGDSLQSPKKAKPVRRFVFGVVIAILAIVIFLIVMGIGIIGYNWNNQFTQSLARIIPYPAILYNNKILPYVDYQDDLNTLDLFFQTHEPEESESQTKARILLRMVNVFLLESKAEEFGISVSGREVDEAFDLMVKQAEAQGDTREDVINLLRNDYDWDVSQFKEKSLRPLVLYTELRDKVSSDETINVEAKKIAEEALALVNKGEQTFEELAEKYSEDITAGQGGDLGFFTKGEMIEEMDEAASNLEVGETSGLVRTQYGYHIIKLLDKVSSSDGQGEQFHVAHILIRSKHIDQWISEELSKAKVVIFVPGFSWHEECDMVLAGDETCDNNSFQNGTSDLNVNAGNTNQ